ncbi:MAG: hypothetical protein M1833_003040 [Piccolia ochrophora]|nr:MAG: hypothetical protein M1833_003040 [Piccolia ochrophora]
MRPHALTELQKERIRGFLDAGGSLRAAAKQFNLARSTIHYVRNAKPDKPKSKMGRPRQLSEATLDEIEQFVDTNPDRDQLSHKSIMQRFNLQCHKATFRRAVYRRGLGKRLGAEVTSPTGTPAANPQNVGDDAPSPSTQTRPISTSSQVQHENPLGLPRSGAAPQVPRMQRGLPQKRRIQDVNKVIAVSSAKGGVGKSTVAVNLALAFARRGLRAGILDTDIFGPSIPSLLNLTGEPRLSSDNRLLPLANYGVKSMSMGYLVGADAPVVWRGLMVTKALQQLLHEVVWGGLDVLVLDLPPGTGDVQLTITQQVELDGAIIVSTPQDIALRDAVKGINMFKKVNVPLLGMIQNMSHFTCPHCNTPTAIFGHAGVARECETHGLELLGDIPLHASICDDADRGMPTVVAEPGSERAAAFENVAERVGSSLGL